METKTTTKGQIVIPAALRKKYGIKKGTRVDVTDDQGCILLRPLTVKATEALLNKLQGMYKGSGMLHELMEERTRDREKEDAGWTAPSVR